MVAMSPEHAVAFFVFAVVAAVTPGPSNIILAAAGASAGILRGLPCLLGVGTGMGLMMFVVPLGLGGLVLGHPLVLTGLHWGGAAVLLWLAWRIATAGGPTAGTPREPVGYFGAALFQWANPKSWLVAASAAGTFLRPDAGSSLVQAAALGGLFVLAALPSGFVWLAFGTAMRRVLSSPRRVRTFNVTMGVLLALSVALILR
jgi:threonine/homoserine/homoserine lactone efflux protein